MPLSPGSKAHLLATAEKGKRDWATIDIDQLRAMNEAHELAYDVVAPRLAVEYRIMIPTPDGGTIGIEIYVPRSSEPDVPMAVMLFLHGGGWVMCSTNSHGNMCRYLCDKAGVIGINVDYRMAPEHKFPTAVNDAATALDWACANIASYGGDPDRIIVAGDSAGGTLATVLAQRSARGEGPPVIAQALFYPSVSMGDHDGFPSFEMFGSGEFGVSAQGCDWITGLYLTDPAQRDDIRFSPIKAPALEGSPPTLLITAEYDPLRDEGEAYAKRLREAGIPVEYHCFAGAIHAFMSMPKLMPDGYVALDLAARFLSRQAMAPLA
ncbi:alpha/beta hydrolase [Sphingobium sp.]|uniref:alpha/beta hydrolase n=1 Tax=Sphingobium sp. TaxID=1912891 RepID=UPI0028BDB7B2|nr:alpha/beta hydrolase [Sphingobium sp.]